MDSKLGLRLNKFVVSNNKETREIELKNGLNIIYGPTDTGKTYIYQCIKYLLGSNTLPKKIPENSDFHDAYLEIKSLYYNSIFTLKRTFSKNKISIYDCPFSEIEKDTESITVNTRGSKNLISTKLLEFSGINPDTKIKTHIRENKYRNIAIRDLLYFSLVTEMGIITDDSLITTGQYTSKTVELNLFYYLISAQHTSYLTYLSDQKSSKKKKQVQNKVEASNILIAELIDETKRELLTLEKIKSNNEVSYSEELLFVTSEIEEQSSKLKSTFENIEKLKTRKMMNRELLKRFKLLTEQFNSDLQRLEFILEGGEIISKLAIENCPTCGGKLVSDRHSRHRDPESIQDINSEVLFASYNAEKKKILLNLNDLTMTINNLENENHIINHDISILEKRYHDIKERIDEELKPTRTSLENKINRAVDEKLIKEKIGYLKQKLYRFQLEVSDSNQIENNKSANQSSSNNIKYLIDNHLDQLCKIMNSYLLDMSFPDVKHGNENVEFDSTANDFIINGKARSVYGKGYRAVIYSVFLVSFMKFCRDNNLPHIGFVVIDSPLTTYQEKENELPEEKVPEDLKERFINTLSNEKNLQIIIFENKFQIPTIDINCIEFTRDRNRGRYGFM